MGQVDRAEPGKVGQQHRRRVVAGADEADRQLPFARAAWCGRPGGRGWDSTAYRRLLGVGRGCGILKQNPHGGQRAGGQIVVDSSRLIYREDSGDERLNLDFSAGDEIEEALKVAPFGPADVSRRVVNALKLVAVIVPAGTVGP